MTRYLALLVLLLAGCTSYPSDIETTRGVVLRYLNADVGTTGPFYKHNKKDIDLLSEADRAQASKLLDRGAAGFVVYAGSYNANAGEQVRIVLVQDNKVVGDFHAAAAQK